MNAMIEQAAQRIRAGGIAVFPTDTAYGLGGMYNDPSVVQKILDAKRRTNTRFTVIAESFEQAMQYFSLSPKAQEFAKQYWPGPVSIAVDDRYSVRVPDNEITRALADAVGMPLIATSANLSGEPETYTLEDARRVLHDADAQGMIAAWINGGTLPHKPPSTIVRITDDRVEVLREGPIKIETR